MLDFEKPEGSYPIFGRTPGCVCNWQQRGHWVVTGQSPPRPKLHRPRHQDEKETKHLEALEGVESRLCLFHIDLLNYDSIMTAVTGTLGVFHLASPCIVDEVRDPQNELLDPALKGTINVLTTAKELGVRRVVVTSSISAIIPSPNWPPHKVKNEESWTDEDYCKQKG